MPRHRFYRTRGKRLFDLAASATGLALLALPLGLIALVSRLLSGPPVLYRQLRVGRHGETFELIKFRTMHRDAEAQGAVTVRGDARITPAGRFLRRFKLDELPQLWNVLRGDMSLVGPRPDVPGYADALEGDARRILELRPGITGPATLAYRNEEELLAAADDPQRLNDEVLFPHKVQLNLRYLDECSFALDLSTILATLLPAPSKRIRLS